MTVSSGPTSSVTSVLKKKGKKGKKRFTVTLVFRHLGFLEHPKTAPLLTETFLALAKNTF